MISIRLIPRLDIKGSNLIKTINLEGLRVLGEPQSFAEKYYEAGADEIIYMDIVASLYGRNHLAELVEYAAKKIFVPLTVGGGVRSLDDVKVLLRSGADKVAINTAAIQYPELVSNAAREFGSQSIVLSIEAKRINDNQWEAYTENGRSKTGVDAVKWAERGVELGAGEILLTSVDREGTRSGFDLKLYQSVSEVVSVPIVASGGMGSVQDLLDVVQVGKVSAVAMADVLHYNRLTLQEIRKATIDQGLCARDA